VSFRDFEYSQKDGMYVHASGKLLICLRNYAHYEMKLVNRAYRNLISEPNDILKTYTTVVIKMLEGIGRYELPGHLSRTGKSGNIAEIIKRCKLNSYYVIEIPPKALFRLESTIFALSHEAGHFIRPSYKVISYWAMLSTLLYSIIMYEKPIYRKTYDRERKRGFQTIEVLDNEIKSIEMEFREDIKADKNIDETEEKDVLNYLDVMKNFLYEFIADTFAVHSVVLKPSQLKKLSVTDGNRLSKIFIKTLDDNLPVSEVIGIHRELRISAIGAVFIKNKKDQGDIFDDASEETLKKWIYENPEFSTDDQERWAKVVPSTLVAEAFYHFHLEDAFNQYSDERNDMPSSKHRAFKQNYFTKANSDAFGLMHDFLDTYQ
jgi:hypothetical protein